MLTVGLLNDSDAVRHAFFGREGGVSDGLYASLNCGFGSRDDASNVAENRRRAAAELDLPADRLVTLYQIHSPNVVTVTAPWAPGDAPQADAMVTSTTGIALGILTADCVPVLLADPKARVIGAAHSGWKGAIGGVLEATVEAMSALGATPENIRAGIGPAIGKRSYEVGPEFPTPFMEQCDKNADFFCQGAREGHFHFDIKGYVARRLAIAGLREIQCLPCDTCAEEDRFFSYRRACLRQEDDYGRDLSAICLEG